MNKQTNHSKQTTHPKQYNTLIYSILFIIVIFFVGILLIKRFMYFRPSSVFLKTRETYKVIKHGNLHGWLLDGPKGTDKIILLCHGNGGNISHNEDRMVSLRALGYSVLAFDYSGYGKSTGTPSERQLYDDTCAMVALLRQQYSPDQITLYGISLGAPVAAYAALRYSIPKLILESPLPSMRAILTYRYPIVSFLGFIFSEFNTLTFLKQYGGKSLVLHSPTDRIIPYNSTFALQQVCTKHIPVDGSHNSPIIPWGDVHKFLQ